VSIWSLIPELPLLRRELTELSNRRRTYIIRFFGAIIVLSLILLFFSQQVAMLQVTGVRANPNRYLGSGGMIFRGMVPMLFYSVQFLMPAMVCGSITLEKERNTIGTLFVTRLSPMTIVIEKLGSRLVPMFTFLLLTFPVLAFVYSLGGVELSMLLGTLWLLFCECLLYASIGLLCSSWFATTATAFIWSYVLTGLLVVFSAMMSHALPVPVPTPYYIWVSVFQSYDEYLRSTAMFRSSVGSIWEVVFIGAASIPSLIATGVMVLMARVFLVRRAFISPTSVLLKVFKTIDGFFTQLNDRTTGGVLLVKDYNSLPLFDPVAWRERAKKSLGKARYLFRILIVMEGPTLFICVGSASMSNRTDFDSLRSLLLFVWAISAMILAMKGGTAISSERARETLDALLSTPMTAKEILSQKIAGMKRLMIVLSIPILSIHLTQLLLNVDPRTLIFRPSVQTVFMAAWYSVLCVLTTFLSMRIIAWLSLVLGLRSHSQSKSSMTAISVIAAWVLIAAFLCRPGGFVFEGLNIAGQRIASRFTSPATQLEQTVRAERIAVGAAGICCMARLDGGVQANEAVLVAIGNPHVEPTSLYYAPSRSYFSAVSVSAIVFGWQMLLLLLLQTLTLRLAPALLQRNDQISVLMSLEEEKTWPSVARGSEVLA